jgi:site-specific recombinase XerD
MWTADPLLLAAPAGVFSIQEAMGLAQISTSQRYVHWARALADSATHKLPIEIA